MSVKRIDKKDIEKALIDSGYHLQYLGTGTRYGKKVYEIRVLLDNGSSYGIFEIPECEGCFDKTDLVLWIQEQFRRLHPELFHNSKEGN